MAKMIRRERAATKSGAQVVAKGSYRWEVILTHPKTRGEFRRFRTDQESAYRFADVIASASVCVDIKRVRVTKR